MSNWNLGYEVVFGNAACGNRPWLAELSQVFVAVDDWSLSLLRAGGLKAPSRYWFGVSDPSLITTRISR